MLLLSTIWLLEINLAGFGAVAGLLLIFEAAGEAVVVVVLRVGDPAEVEQDEVEVEEDPSSG